MTKPEWEFDESPEKVSLVRIWNELLQLPFTVQMCYMADLERLAPVVHARLNAWILEHKKPKTSLAERDKKFLAFIRNETTEPPT